MGVSTTSAEPASTANPPSDPSTAKADSDAHIGDKYHVPTYEPHSSFDALKERIRHHYELASDYYYSLW